MDGYFTTLIYYTYKDQENAFDDQQALYRLWHRRK